MNYVLSNSNVCEFWCPIFYSAYYLLTLLYQLSVFCLVRLHSRQAIRFRQVGKRRSQRWRLIGVSLFDVLGIRVRVFVWIPSHIRAYSSSTGRSWSVPIWFYVRILLKLRSDDIKDLAGSLYCSDTRLMTHGPLLMNSLVALMHSAQSNSLQLANHWPTTFVVTFKPKLAPPSGRHVLFKSQPIYAISWNEPTDPLLMPPTHLYW